MHKEVVFIVDILKFLALSLFLCQVAWLPRLGLDSSVGQNTLYIWFVSPIRKLKLLKLQWQKVTAGWYTGMGIFNDRKRELLL